MVTIAAAGDATGDERTQAALFIAEPDRAQLVEIGRPLDAGELRPAVGAVLPCSEAAKAFAATIERKGRGEL